MTRMIDRMLAHGFVAPGWSSSWFLADYPKYRDGVLATLREAVAFSVDNVCRYYYSNTDREYWDLEKDFPNLAPPYPAFFIEMQGVRNVRDEGGRLRQVPGICSELESWGVLFEALDCSVPENDINSPKSRARLKELAEYATRRYGKILAEKAVQYGDQLGEHLTTAERYADLWIRAQSMVDNGQRFPPVDGRFRWTVDATLFIENREHEVAGPVLIIQYLADGAGAIHGRPIWKRTYIPESPDSTGQFNAEIENWMSLFGPAFLALSFLHCKNVKVARETPPAPLSRAFQKRHGRPLVRFHTLQITPMRKVLEREGNAATAGLRKALHICRGHFKTFTPDGKLFGRLSGTYWWDAHVRGSREQGLLLKDYEVNRPAPQSSGG